MVPPKAGGGGGDGVHSRQQVRVIGEAGEVVVSAHINRRPPPPHSDGPQPGAAGIRGQQVQQRGIMPPVGKADAVLLAQPHVAQRYVIQFDPQIGQEPANVTLGAQAGPRTGGDGRTAIVKLGVTTARETQLLENGDRMTGLGQRCPHHQAPNAGPDDYGVVPLAHARMIGLERHLGEEAVVGTRVIAQVAVGTALSQHLGPAVAGDSVVRADQNAIGTAGAALLDELHTGSSPLAGYQHIPLALLYRFPLLVDHPHVEDDRPTTQARHRF